MLRVSARLRSTSPRKVRIRVVSDKGSCLYEFGGNIAQTLVDRMVYDIKHWTGADVAGTVLGNARKLSAWLRGGFLRTLEVESPGSAA